MLRTSLHSLLVCGLAVSVVAAVSCDSGSARKPAGTTGSAGTGSATGAAGTTGASGTTGAAGDTGTGASGTTGAAGDTGTGAAGTTGAAGDTGAGVAGTTGSAGTTGGAGTTGAAGDSGGAGTTGAAGTGAAVDNTPYTPLPITVTSTWFPSGYYGDAYTMTLFAATGAMRPITMSAATDGPCAARVAGALGECWKVVYQPQVAEGGATGFAGVAFLSAVSNVPNWDMPLKAPRPAKGATVISAQVAGAVGGEAVDINAGTQLDGFQGKQSVVLTKAWQQVDISLAGATYDHVISAWGWGSASTTPITFYYDNVVMK